MRHLPAAAATVATALVLAACGASVHHASRPPAGQCAQVETAIRQIALVTSHFTGVTSSRDLAAAFKQLARDGVLTGSAQSYLVMVKNPTLSQKLRLVETDYQAFWAATRHLKPRPQAVAAAAQKTTRDIRAIRATCLGQ